MILKNAEVFDHRFEKRKLSVRIDGERIAEVTENPISAQTELDLTDCLILPGFIDIHIHGAGGGDFSEGEVDSLHTMSRFLADNGITSFCPTGMTQSPENLERQFRAARQAFGFEPGAYMHGIHLEGPYINPLKKGAQREADIRPADYAEFERLNGICPVRMVSMAPETEGALAFSRKVSKVCTLSMAHTMATFDEANEALQNGFSHATHLFNAMPGLQSRNPGLIAAVFDSETATAELICDGFHVHPSMIRLTFRQLGEDRICAVSDSMRASGLADGEYTLGGQRVLVRDGKATLPDGTIAASTTNIFAEFRNLLSFGIPMRAAVKACTINPAKVIGVSGQTGSIEPGKFADLLVLDKDLQIRHVFIRGRQYK